jgi:uncharacterized damage-inducible protein DinB
MKKFLLAGVILIGSLQLSAQSLKSVLVQQLKTTHDKQEWFVPVQVALEGVTSEQATWNAGGGNHSIGQLANHLLFWNERLLTKFKGGKEAPFNGNNDETFNSFTKDQWTETVKKLNAVLTELEQFVQNADDAFLKSNAETIANISTHNAYHTGQIIVVRRLQGSWNPEKGVK